MAMSITLKDFLETSGISYDVEAHPYAVSSMYTATQAHVSGEQLAKGVVLKDDYGYLVAVVPSTHHVHLGKLRKEYKRYFALADERDIHALFNDCSEGAIPPIGHAYGVDVIFDDCLNDYDDIYFESGDHMGLVHVSAGAFQNLMGKAPHGEISQHI